MKLFKKKHVKVSREELNNLFWNLIGIKVCSEQIEENIDYYSDQPDRIELMTNLILANTKSLQENLEYLWDLYETWNDKIDV